ncbi:MAG TPA: MFS transporter, partial [Mucilaginibacter sp.]
ILPESLPPSKRRPLDVKKINPFTSVFKLKKYQSVFGLAISLFLIYFAGQAVQTVWTFYTMSKFHWDADLVGYSLGFVGLLIALVQGGLIRIILPKLGQERSIWIGLIFYATGLILFAFATKGWMMFAFLIPYCLGGIAGPALQGYMSTNVPDNEQGNLQGGLTGLMSLSAILGPLAMTSSFHYFTTPNPWFQFPGAPFLIGAFCMLLSAVLAVRSFKRNTN